MLNNKFELDMVELVLPLSAVSEKSPSSTVEMTPSAEIDDGEKSREKIINIIRVNPTVTQLELSNLRSWCLQRCGQRQCICPQTCIADSGIAAPSSE